MINFHRDKTVVPLKAHVGWGEVVAPAPPRPRPTHLDHLPAIHLHELAQVLLQQVGVGAPLEEAQQVH